MVGQTADDELTSTARLRQRFGMVSVVRVSSDAGHTGATPAAASASVIRVTDDVPFAPAWNQAIASSQARPGVARSAR